MCVSVCVCVWVCACVRACMRVCGHGCMKTTFHQKSLCFTIPVLNYRIWLLLLSVRWEFGIEVVGGLWLNVHVNRQYILYLTMNNYDYQSKDSVVGEIMQFFHANWLWCHSRTIVTQGKEIRGPNKTIRLESADQRHGTIPSVSAVLSRNNLSLQPSTSVSMSKWLPLSSSVALGMSAVREPELGLKSYFTIIIISQ